MTFLDMVILALAAGALLFCIARSGKRLAALLGRLGGFLANFIKFIKNRFKARKWYEFAILAALLLFLAWAIMHGRGQSSVLAFILAFLFAFAGYMVFSFLIYVYYAVMGDYIEMASVTNKRLFSLFSVLMLFLLTGGGVTLVQAVVIALFTLTFYFVNLRAMLTVVFAAKRGTYGVTAIWKNVFIIIGAFIVCLTVLSYTASLMIPGSFSRDVTFFDLLYYTLVTFATVGYGDITPTHPVTQVVSVMTVITSMLCIVFFANAILSITSSMKIEDESKKKKNASNVGRDD